MFQPRYLKQAKLLLKGVTRFLHYKQDLLPAAKLEEIQKMRQELADAIRNRDSKRIDTLTLEINRTCEKALPEARSSEVAENIEVFFVSIVIALGIRSYIAQPFQIPTGSMQPTLNGIIAEYHAEDPTPGLLGRMAGWFTGTTYINVVSDHDGELADPTYGGPAELARPVSEHKFLIFRPYSTVHFKDGHTINISCPKGQLEEDLKFTQHVNGELESESTNTPDLRSVNRLTGADYVRKGQLLARGIVRNGDHVIVNKFVYHFRKPTRGEVLVFTTKNIEEIEGDTARFNMSWGSQHYIKRLVGLPGDELDVQPPEVVINGQNATEPGIRKVIDNHIPYERNPSRTEYHGYASPPRYSRIHLPIKLQQGERPEYFALGDNSYYSSDSRYWGPVPQQNVVGPGWFCYWPLTKHWGPIR